MKRTYVIIFLFFAVTSFPQNNALAELIGITQLAPMNESRALFGAAFGADNKIYVFGGSPGQQVIRVTIESYDSNTYTWTYNLSMPGPKAWHRAATAPDGTIYVFGGSITSGPSTDVWAYNPANDTWDTSLPQMPVEERDTVAATGADGIIYLFGGYWNYNTVQAFNPSTKSWQIKTSMPTGRWAAAGALGPDGKIYIVGGGYPDQPDYGVYNTLEVYDPKTDTWVTKAPMTTARNYLGAAFGGDGLLYAIGGEVYGAGRTGIMYDVIEAYNPQTDTWTVAGYLPIKLSGLSLVTDNYGNIHCLGGYSPPNLLSTNSHYLLQTTVITVNIDIKPGSDQNTINLNNKGNVPVAILSSPTFNSASVDSSSVVFAGANPLPKAISTEDVNGDGLPDIVLHFNSTALNLKQGNTEACLSGKAVTGLVFKGCGTVKVIQ